MSEKKEKEIQEKELAEKEEGKELSEKAKEEKEEVKEKETAKESDEKTSKNDSKEESDKEDLNDSEVIDLNKDTSEIVTPEKEDKKKKSKKAYSDFVNSTKKKRRRKRIIILLIIIGLIVAGAFYMKKKADEAKVLMEASMQNNIQTAEVESKTLYETVPATGNLIPRESVTLSTILQSSSKIEEVNVKVGDYVEKDDILVRFSTEDINKEINQTQEDIANQKKKDQITASDAERKYVYSYTSAANSLQSASANVNTKLNALHEACNQYGDAKRKLQAKIDEGVTDENILETYRASVSSALKQQESAQRAYDEAVEAEAKTISEQQNGLSDADSSYLSSSLTLGDQVKSSTRQLEKLEDSLDNYIVTASISGVVTQVNVSEGNSFQNGSVLTIQDTSSMEVEVLVDEYDIPKVKKAFTSAQDKGEELKVEIKTNATDDDLFKGHVISIAPTSTSTASYATSASTSSSGSGSGASSSSDSSPQYKVKVSLDEMDDAFMVGMSAKVSIIVNESPANALCVPYNAVDETSDGEFVVHVVDNNSKKMPNEDSGIVVENNTTQSGKGSKPTPSGGSGNSSKRPGGFGISSLLGGLTGSGNGNFEGPTSAVSTHDVKVKKIFDTDYYTAVVPVNANELKVGDTVAILNEKDSSGGDMNMFMGGGPGMMR